MLRQRETPSPRRPAASDATDPPARLLVAASLLAVYFAWGSTYLAIRVAVETLPPFLLAGARALTAGLVLLGWVRLRGLPRASGTQARNAAVCGVLLLAGGNGLVTWAEQSVSSALAASVVASGAVWTVILLALLGEKPSRLEYAGVVAGLVGVVLLHAEGEMRAHPLGAAALLAATLSWSMGSVASRRLDLPVGVRAVAIEMLAGGAAMTAGGLLAGERLLPAQVSAASLAAWVYLVVAGSLVGFTAFSFLIRNVRPALATSFAYVNPAVALLLGVTLGGETVGFAGLAGVGVCILGVALVSLAPKPR